MDVILPQENIYHTTWVELQQMPSHIHIHNLSFKVKHSLHQGSFYLKSFLTIIGGGQVFVLPYPPLEEFALLRSYM